MSGILIIGHNIIPHHHHIKGYLIPDQINDHHTDKDSRDHNHFFSFAHLEDSFIFSQKSDITKLNFECIVHLPPSLISNHTGSYLIYHSVFPEVEELPPPDQYFLAYGYRGPPHLS